MESENHTSLAADLWKKRPDFTDVVFVVGGKEFPAHKMVLASKSEYFKSMLYGRMREASQKKIPLFFHDNIVTPATFEKVLKFAYTESLEVCAPLHVSFNVKGPLANIPKIITVCLTLPEPSKIIVLYER